VITGREDDIPDYSAVVRASRRPPDLVGTVEVDPAAKKGVASIAGKGLGAPAAAAAGSGAAAVKRAAAGSGGAAPAAAASGAAASGASAEERSTALVLIGPGTDGGTSGGSNSLTVHGGSDGAFVLTDGSDGALVVTGSDGALVVHGGSALAMTGGGDGSSLVAHSGGSSGDRSLVVRGSPQAAEGRGAPRLEGEDDELDGHAGDDSDANLLRMNMTALRRGDPDSYAKRRERRAARPTYEEGFMYKSHRAGWDI